MGGVSCPALRRARGLGDLVQARRILKGNHELVVRNLGLRPTEAVVPRATQRAPRLTRAKLDRTMKLRA